MSAFWTVRRGDIVVPTLTWPPLIWTRFVERPNRFLVHAEMDGGELAVTHLADPGRLEELLVPGARVAITPAVGEKRKTEFSVVLVDAGSSLVSLHTGVPNRLARDAFERGAIPEFAHLATVRREVTVGKSRFDFEMSNEGADRCLVEVKSASLVENGIALFPDAVTARGKRHVEELTALKLDGVRTAVLAVIQRSDAHAFAADGSRDPKFSAALENAKESGVEVLAMRCEVTEEGISLTDRVPVWSGWPPSPPK